MAKEFEDKFYDELKSSVVGGKDQISLEEMSIEEKVRALSELPIEEIKQAIASMSLADQKAIYAGCISVLDSNVIKDPRSLESLKKELDSVTKKIDKKAAEKALEDGDLVTREATETSGEESEDKEEKNDDEKDQDNTAKEEKLKQDYYDAIVAYYDARLKTLRHQRETGDLLSSDKDFKEEEKLELEMYQARKAYMALGNSDPYEKFRARHDYIDRQAHEPFEKKIREKTSRYREIEEEIRKIDQEISEINEELDTKELNERDRANRTERIQELEAKKTKLDLEKAEYKDVEQITDQQRVRAAKNPQLQKLRREAASKEQIKGYDYRRTQRQVSQYNLDVAQKTEYNNIQKRIEEREDRIKQLEKQLKETPDEDLETRLNILEALNKETNMMQADEEQQHNLDMGYVASETEMKQETYRAYQEAEETQQQFIEDTREVREAIEEQSKVEGELAVEQASILGEEQKEREIEMKAATAAAIIDSPEPGRDTLAQDAGQYMVAKCVIEGLEDKVRDPNDPEDAQAMVDQDEQLRQADKQLDAVQQNLEDKI